MHPATAAPGSHCHASCFPSRNATSRVPARVRASPKSDLVRDIRPVPIKLVSVSKGNSKAAADMAGEWREKLERYVAVAEVVVKPNPKSSPLPKVQTAAEGDKVGGSGSGWAPASRPAHQAGAHWAMMGSSRMRCMKNVFLPYAPLAAGRHGC